MLRLSLLATAALLGSSPAFAQAQSGVTSVTTATDETEPRMTLNTPTGQRAGTVITVSSTPRPNPADTPASQRPDGPRNMAAMARRTSTVSDMQATLAPMAATTARAMPAPADTGGDIAVAAEAPPATAQAQTSVTTETDEVEPIERKSAPGGAPAGSVVTTSSAPRPNPADTPPSQQPTPDRVAAAPATADEVAAPGSSTVEAPQDLPAASDDPTPPIQTADPADGEDDDGEPGTDPTPQ